MKSPGAPRPRERLLFCPLILGAKVIAKTATGTGAGFTREKSCVDALWGPNPQGGQFRGRKVVGWGWLGAKGRLKRQEVDRHPPHVGVHSTGMAGSYDNKLLWLWEPNSFGFRDSRRLTKTGELCKTEWA